MYEKLRKRVNELFENAPKTGRANELKEELLANLIEKYNDLIDAGNTPDEAVEKAMKELSPENYQYNDLYRYNHYHGGRAFSTVMSTASSHSTSGSDGAGGVGGGSGGGGGGAF